MRPVAALVVTGSVGLATVADAAQSETLFCIERSKNANVVCYDVRLDDDRQPHADRPVSVYWILHAEDGRRDKLSWLEKKAYGFEITKKPSRGSFRMRLSAFPKRELSVARAGGRFRAQLSIDGRPAYLTSIFVKTKERGIRPQVVYVELHGTDVENSKKRVERINSQ